MTVALSLLAAVFVWFGLSVFFTTLYLRSGFRRFIWSGVLELARSFEQINKGAWNAYRHAMSPQRSSWGSHSWGRQGIIVMPTARPPTLESLVAAAQRNFLEAWPSGKSLDFVELEHFEAIIYQLYEWDWDGKIPEVFAGFLAEQAPDGPPVGPGRKWPQDYPYAEDHVAYCLMNSGYGSVCNYPGPCDAHRKQQYAPSDQR